MNATIPLDDAMSIIVRLMSAMRKGGQDTNYQFMHALAWVSDPKHPLRHESYHKTCESLAGDRGELATKANEFVDSIISVATSVAVQRGRQFTEDVIKEPSTEQLYAELRAVGDSTKIDPNEALRRAALLHVDLGDRAQNPSSRHP